MPHSDASTKEIDDSDNPADVDFGYSLDRNWIMAQAVNGLSQGYWKTNIEKALKGTTKGVQVSAATLGDYVGTLSAFQLSPLNPSSLSSALSFFTSTSPAPAGLHDLYNNTHGQAMSGL